MLKYLFLAFFVGTLQATEKLEVEADLAEAPDHPEQIKLAYGPLLGTWKCSGSSNRNADGERIRHEFEDELVSYTFDLKGNWVKMDYTTTSKDISRCMFGKNGEQLTKLCYGTIEGHTLDSSDGWKKNVLLFKGKSYYKDYISDTSKRYTKINDKTYKVFATVTNKAENYYVEWKATCNKVE